MREEPREPPAVPVSLLPRIEASARDAVFTSVPLSELRGGSKMFICQAAFLFVNSCLSLLFGVCLSVAPFASLRIFPSLLIFGIYVPPKHG